MKPQAGSVHVTKWEKELHSKLESVDTARHTIGNSDSRTEELELQLQKCIIEKNDLEIKMEEAIQDTGQHITCSVFKLAVHKMGLPSFSQRYMFQGEKISNPSSM